MTTRVTVSLPDDLAAYLARSGNASAAVARAVRSDMNRGEQTRAMLAAMGMSVNEERLAEWRKRLKPMDEEQLAQLAELRRLTGRPPLRDNTQAA